MEPLYDFFTRTGNKEQRKEPEILFTLNWVKRSCTPAEKIRQIARSSGFKEGTVIGVMEEVEKWTSFYIFRGECVEIGHMAMPWPTWRAGKEITERNRNSLPRPSDSIKYMVSHKQEFQPKMQGTGTFPSQDRMEIPGKVPPDTRKRNAAPAHGVSKAASVHQGQNTVSWPDFRNQKPGRTWTDG